MGNIYLERANRGARALAVFTTIATAGLQTSSSGDLNFPCPPTPVFRFAQVPDFSTEGINFKTTTKEPWYYSLDIERIFNPDGSMNISCGMLDAIKRDAATAAITQYSGRDARVNSQREQLTTTLVNATSFLDKKSYEEIRNQLIKDNKINEKRSMNDIYVIDNGRVFINQDSRFLTKAIASTGNSVALLNKQGYPTRTARIYLQSAYVIMLHDAVLK